MSEDHDHDLRRRTANKQAGREPQDDGKVSATAEKAKTKTQAAVPQSGFSFVDILRVVATLAIVSTIGSYLITRGESYIWGVKQPWWTKPAMIKASLVPKLELTNEELAAYDGNDPDKPILLALNRTIYDVSKSPAVYGPGGMYSTLAAKDASRSYITTCFDPVDDLVPYFGGVEEVYVPLWLSTKPGQEELDEIAEGEVMEGMGMTGLIDEIQRKIGRRKSRLMKEKAYEDAKERVRAQVRTWEDMFAKKEYPIVGRVIGVDEEDESKWKDLKFCDAAKKQRPALAESLAQAMKALGSKDGNVNIGQMKRRPGKSGMRDGLPVREPKVGEKVRVNPSKVAEGLQNEAAKANVEELMKGGKYAEGMKSPGQREKDRRKAAREAKEQQANA